MRFCQHKVRWFLCELFAFVFDGDNRRRGDFWGIGVRPARLRATRPPDARRPFLRDSGDYASAPERVGLRTASELRAVPPVACRPSSSRCGVSTTAPNSDECTSTTRCNRLNFFADLFRLCDVRSVDTCLSRPVGFLWYSVRFARGVWYSDAALPKMSHLVSTLVLILGVLVSLSKTQGRGTFAL